MHLFLDARLPA